MTTKNQKLLMKWKCHTPNLLQEVLCNPSTSVLSIPLNILGRLLYEVGERASQLNDPELNRLMLQLTLYEVADPESPNYDLAVMKEYNL
jgi:hypothetical protein